MITAFHDMPTTVRAMKLGAVSTSHKPLEIDEIEAAIERVLKTQEQRRTEGSGHDPASAHFREHDIVGKSKAMKEVSKRLASCQSKSTVVIEGESGTGKELIARAIHDHTDKSKPFISINCSASQETLRKVSSSGMKEGAFTGRHPEARQIRTR